MCKLISYKHLILICTNFYLSILKNYNFKVLVGELPNDFLRILSTQEKQDQMTRDSELARQIAKQEMSAYRHVSSSQTQHAYVDRLLISVVEVSFTCNILIKQFLISTNRVGTPQTSFYYYFRDIDSVFYCKLS